MSKPLPPAKPHLWRSFGAWVVSPEGRALKTHNVAPRPSFPEACHLAMLAAIHSGAWRA